METYTIKQGDTLNNIAKQYGTTVSKIVSANGIQDPNLIQSGQAIKIPKTSVLGNIAKTVFAPLLTGSPTAITTPENPVVNNSEVNIGNLPSTPITPVQQPVTVLSYKDNPDGTTTNFLSDGTTSTVNYSKNQDGSLQPSEVKSNVNKNGEIITPTLTPYQDTSKAKSLLDDASNLQQEIATLEESIRNKSSERNSAYEDAGIFDDIKKLNDLKDDLKTKLKERQVLRGTGATSTEFNQATIPELEKNYIEASTLSNIVTANMAAIDQKINDKYEADTFLYGEKNKRLDAIVKSYGDIMTEEQKAKLEDIKQKNAIELEDIKTKNEITKNAASEALKAGANPNLVAGAVASGDMAKLYALSGNTKTDLNESSLNAINTVQKMLDNSNGLSSSVGPTFMGKTLIPGADAEKFRTDAKNLASQSTLDYFVKLKANGATFGAMTEQEWALVASASPVAILGINPQTGKSNLGEEEFIKRAQEYQSAARKAITADALTKAGFDPSFLKNLDGNAVKALYDKYANNSSTVDYTQQDTGNFIQKEEGFSPTAYQDQAGVWTIGYGTTKVNGVPVKQGDTITEPEAKKLAIAQAVNDYSTFADKLGNTNLTPNQFTALNSFEYNLGPGIWDQPTGKQILASVQNGDFNTAANLMQRFVNVKNPQTGKLEPNKTLIARRQREGNLLLS